MRNQNLRKVKWDKERNRAYVLRDNVRYWAPENTAASPGDPVQVLNPNTRSISVKSDRLVPEIWRTDATSPGEGG